MVVTYKNDGQRVPTSSTEAEQPARGRWRLDLFTRSGVCAVATRRLSHVIKFPPHCERLSITLKEANVSEAEALTVRCWNSQALRMLVATLGKMPLFLLCSFSLSGSSSSPVLGDATPLSRQSPDQHTEILKKNISTFCSVNTRPLSTRFSQLKLGNLNWRPCSDTGPPSRWPTQPPPGSGS